MSNPISSYSNESNDFLHEYGKKVKSDPRLEFHQDIVQDFGESYERAYQLWNTFYAEAYRDQSYYLGNQWSLEELAYLNNQRRSANTYNKSRKLIDLVAGKEITGRTSLLVSPIEDSSEMTAEIKSDLMQYVMQFGRGYEVCGEAFKGGLITGLSFVQPWVDFRSDPVSGDIQFHHDPWNSVILDPFFTKRDLSDCSFVARRKYLSRTQVISLLPDKQDEIEQLPWGSRDDKFTYMPYARQWGMQKLLNYSEYWRTKWETKNMLVDRETGEMKEWKGDKRRIAIMREMYPQLELMRKPVRSVELGIIVEGQLLYYGKDPSGLDDYPFVPFIPIFEPSYDLYTWKIQSLMRILRDSQTEINKRRSKKVDILDNQLNSGWKAKTNSVSNPSSLYKTGQGQVVWMKPEAQMTDAERIQPAAIDASHFALEAEFEKDLFETLGISPESVGMAENDKVETAGVLAKMRQMAGWVPMEGIFEGLRESKRLVGEKVMRLTELNYTPEKVKRITKKEPTPEFFSGNFSRYNVVVQEGILTDTQKQADFVGKVALRTMGVNITDLEIIASSNLHDKEKIFKRIEGEMQQAKQAQEQQMQLQMQNQQIVTKSVDAKAEADRSLAAERLNKVGLDAALNMERMTRAEEERTAGALNIIKAIKELDTMDLNNLMQKVAILKEIEGKNSEEPKKNSA
jgi:hypothetical protein